MSTSGERSILHVDLDAFFAAVEQRDRPELRGKPVLVGGDPKGRGVVSTASYEARPFGCHSAMSMARAVRLCPHAIVVRPRMKRYGEASRQVFDILEKFTPLVEPVSIDEAFLDVTGSIRLLGQPEEIAQGLRRRIREETGLTASAGVATNKFIAKLASDLNKPDGLVVVQSDQVRAFLDPLPISRLWGVGKVTLPRLESLGVRTFADLRRFPQVKLKEHFGKAGEQFYRLVRGIDSRELVPDRRAKSISHEVTFSVDVQDYDHLRAVLLDQVEHVARRLRQHQRMARTVTMKVRTADFKTVTRGTTLSSPTDRTDAIWQVVSTLFEKWWRWQPSAVRLIGVGVSQLSSDAEEQLGLFAPRADSGSQRLDCVVDEIRDRYGDEAIARGAHITLRDPQES